MSPIDDELRRTLTAHATDVPPIVQPLIAVERRARAIRRRRHAVGGACAAVAIVSGAIVLPLLSKATSPTPVTVVPATHASSATAPSVPSSAPAPSPSPIGAAVAVYYLGDTASRVALHREWRKTPSADRVRAAVELMLKPPLDPDYRTLWPAGTAVRAVSIDGEVGAVDLTAQALTGSGGSAAACRTLQQLVWTVTAANTSIRQVSVSVEGRTQGVVSQWWGVGCGPDAPMKRGAPSYDIVAPVQISKFNEGDSVRSRLSFGGEAAVFEARLSWAVVRGDGTQLAAGTAQVSKGAPARGQWQAIVVLNGVSRGDIIELRAWEPSGKDGSVTYLDTKRVRISG